MAEIKLGHGYVALVDEDDEAWLNQWRWYRSPYGYAVRTQNGVMSKGVRKNKGISMHRLINGTPAGLETDHINRNRLDNRRQNLRTCTRRENVLNRGLFKTNKSGCAGVNYHKLGRYWIARITKDGNRICLGKFTTCEEAIAAKEQALA